MGIFAIKCPVMTTYLGYQNIYLARKSSAIHLARILVRIKTQISPNLLPLRFFLSPPTNQPQ